MKTLLKLIIAMAIAMAMMLALMAVGASGRVCLTVYFTAGLVLATLFGVFDIPESGKGSIRKEDADTQMRDAA